MTAGSTLHSRFVAPVNLGILVLGALCNLRVLLALPRFDGLGALFVGARDGALRRENPEEERINVPAIAKHYWRYRMHLTLEDLMGQEAFNGELKRMVKGSGRL